MSWDLREKAQSHIVTVGFALIALLLLVIWRAVDPSIWDKVSEATPKRVLWALAALEGIAICFLTGALIDKWRKAKKAVPVPEMTKRFGVLWDDKSNPYCPVDQTLMRVRAHASNLDHDILLCPKCNNRYPLRTDEGRSLLLPTAQDLILGNQRHSVIYGILWDDSQNPFCPVCQTPLYIGERLKEASNDEEYDILGCPKCHHKYPIRDEHIGLLTLADAKNEITQRALYERSLSK